MNWKARRIFIAAALGTMAGLYASIAFLPAIAWWFGALVSGICAGFLYALPDIIRYSPLAFQVAKNDSKKIRGIFSAFPKIIRGMPSYGKWYLLLMIMYFSLTLTWMWLVVVIDRDNLYAPIVILAGFFYIAPAVIIAMWPSLKKTEAEKIKAAKKALFYITPPGTLFMLALGMVKFGPRTIKGMAKLFSMILLDIGYFLITFAKTLFFLVHSKELVLCGIDAGFGVLISYPLLVTAGNLQTGPALLFGGLIGGILGVLHYEIVSVRILRVA
ncbi:MAG: hypothetical protein Q7K11_01790 [Candidatus Berkelbacteria bacterium]|nr:hypothetical protein [Candidatus Berkelbacteria bacterium]